MSTFQVSMNQILSMFAFILIGYVLRKTNYIPDIASKILSTILVNVCMPALIFLNCASNMTVDKLFSQSALVLSGTVVLALSYGLGILLSKVFAKSDFERKVYTYSFTIPNIGYMGSPLVEAVFGSAVLFDVLMFIFPMYIFIYSKGMNMLSPTPQKSFKHVILHPSIVAIIAGVLVGLLGIKLPAVVESVASSASSCVGPIAMILTGCVLAGKRFLDMLKDTKVYIASLLRLIVIPFAAIAIMVLCKVDSRIIIAAGSMLAMPLGLNTVVFPEAYGGDGSKGASLALISHTLSIATIPVVFNFLSTLI